RLQKGDLVVLDFGCVYNGYHSDMTRTFAVGEVDDFSKKIYDIVRTAQQKALDALKAGITGKELDAIARDYIASKGYGETFGHSLGHGFGLMIHEAPNASTASEWTFEPGMTITVEPGIYIEGRLGVRIEDCCVVTETGKIDLVSSTKELLSVE
ncbi:MAG: M24 family metallopeptidase, partial [Clostridia bacterium]|nr:M24 family metallopeptidase [Clostridia bacterium]